jgi:hypothetical protein
MRPARALLLLGLSIVSSGCALMEDATRNAYVALSTPYEVHREIARNRRWAEAAWLMAGGQEPHSEDYAQGFKDGFVEYLYRGGDGEPPLVAPLHYRHARYQTPLGYQAIQDWFAGYRQGAAAAKASGARQWITGPSSLPTDPFVALMHQPIPPAKLMLPADDLGQPAMLQPLPLIPQPQDPVSPVKIEVELPPTEPAPISEPGPLPESGLPEQILPETILKLGVPLRPMENPETPSAARARILSVTTVPELRIRIKAIMPAPENEP